MTSPPDPPLALETAAPAATEARPHGARIVRLALGFYGIVALFAFGYALFSGNLKVLLGVRAVEWNGLLGALGVAALLVALARVGERVWGPMRRAADELTHLLGPLGTGEAILLGLLSGIAEELLFRGALWVHLDLLGTTLLFALVHVLPRRALWVYPAFALVGGFLLGLLRHGTGSVIPPMIAHVLVNAVNLAWLGARTRPPALPAR